MREVARALGDTPAVARSSYIDPRLINRYESAGELSGIPPLPPVLPAPAGTETAIAAFLASCGDGVVPAGDPGPPGAPAPARGRDGLGGQLGRDRGRLG